jgi:tRNA(Ile)-lysidine synthase
MTATGARSAAPADALVARFREALARLWPEGGKLGLAVSGGPDSLALLLLAQAAIPGEFEVATVDHGLRSDSAGECAMVAEACGARAVACEVLRIDVARGNLQAEARRARYDALALWAKRRGLSAIATGHHADDQAETLLMRLNRGSGLAGLAGVREQGAVPEHGTPLVRPLLRFRRAELAGLVAASRLTPVLDPSNEDDRFDRARIRLALTDADWIDPLALAKSASLLGEAQRAIEALAEEEMRGRVVPENEGYRYYPRPSSPYVTLEVVRTILARMGGHAQRSEVARLIERLRLGQAGNLASVHVRPSTEQMPHQGAVDLWVFRREPPRRLH